MLIYIRLLFLIILLMLSACASIGPGQVQSDRNRYNEIVKKTDEEQILMNIVRRRYEELLEFIQIGSITAAYSLNPSATTSLDATLHPGPTKLTSDLAPQISYSDSPTISYIPLSDPDFAQSLMTPVDMTKFLLLANAGNYDYINLMRVFFERLNEITAHTYNREGVDFTTTDFYKFNQIFDLIGDLSKHNQLDLPRSVLYQKNIGLMLRFKDGCEKKPKALRLKKLLNIVPESHDIIFVEHTIEEDVHPLNGLLVLDTPKFLAKNVVYVRFRSLLSAMHLLSFSIHVPKSHMKKQMTREIFNPDGTYYNNIRFRLRNVMNIYCTNSMPGDDVLVKVLHHDRWYYIKDSDKASKDTFAALIRLYTLTSAIADNTNSQPLLTIPVQRPG